MSVDIAEEQVIRANHDVVFCELGGGMALLDLRSNTYYGLNKVGARIWELVQEPRSVSQLCDAIMAQYDVEPSRCYGDVVALLRQLADAKLVRMGDEGAS